MERKFYKKHAYQRFFEKEEIKDILEDMMLHQNLLFCIVYGKDHNEYEERLMLTCQKLAFVSSMFFTENRTVAKLPSKYYKRFFENYLESLEEAKFRTKDIGGDESKEEYVYKTYDLIKQMSLPFLTDTSEVWYAYEFRAIIEYAMMHSEPPENVKALFRLEAEMGEHGIEYGNFYA